MNDDKKKALELALAKIEKDFGKGSIMRLGENAAMVRELSLGKLGVLGFEVDHERNLAARFGKSGFINKEGTRPAVVIPTNEELVIAQDASRLTA